MILDGVLGNFLAPGGVELRPRRFLEVRGSPELQNGGLRALEEAWDDFSRPSSFARKGFRSLSRHRPEPFPALRLVSLGLGKNSGAARRPFSENFWDFLGLRFLLSYEGLILIFL